MGVGEEQREEEREAPSGERGPGDQEETWVPVLAQSLGQSSGFLRLTVSSGVTDPCSALSQGL